MAYWLMKSEPYVLSWDDLVKAGRLKWDDIRNYAARNNLRAMKVGDEAFYYHSNAKKETGIVGIMKIVKEHEPDPSFKGDPNPWLVVTVEPVKPLRFISLQELKTVKGLEEMALFRQSRLSVQPVTAAEWKITCQLAEN